MRIVGFLFCLWLTGLPALTVLAQEESERTLLDVSIDLCRAFQKSLARYHAAYHVITDHYETRAGQAKPVPVLKGVDNPEKLEEFMNWYGDGGEQEVFLEGEMCGSEMTMKNRSCCLPYRAQDEIANGQMMLASFFVERIVKRYNGLVQDYNSLLKASQEYARTSQAYIGSLQSNSRLRTSPPVFVFPRPQTLTCTGDTTAFSSSTAYPGSTSTTSNAITNIHCQ